MTHDHKRDARTRRGLVSVAVLVCLVILTMVAGVLLRLSQLRRDRLRLEQRAVQASWLAESGLRRGLARLASDPSYRGESWTIPASAFGNAADNEPAKVDQTKPPLDQDAVVEISVDPKANGKNQSEVLVRADYPRDPQLRVRKTLRFLVEKQSASTKGASN